MTPKKYRQDHDDSDAEWCFWSDERAAQYAKSEINAYMEYYKETEGGGLDPVSYEDWQEHY